jgi:hypothetical protein
MVGLRRSSRTTSRQRPRSLPTAALRTKNPTVASKGVPKEVIDSRARTQAEIPDPELHQTPSPQAIADRRPLVVVFSTPGYCVSQFAGRSPT